MEKALGREVSLAPYTSWRVGGRAEQLYSVSTLEALSQFLQQLPAQEPLLWIGRGSNLLVRDGGFHGTVILFAEGADQLELQAERTIYAEAGVALPRLARFARSTGWSHLDFLAGIPGSVGGALAMNAGAFGGEIWQQVVSVEVMNHQGVRQWLPPESFDVGYRCVRSPALQQPYGFVAALFKNGAGQQPVAPEALKRQLKQRNQSQPMAEYSCGSVFRNPPGDHAGRLIEAAGMKGVCIGAVCVSTQHANFIVHSGGATATEIEALIEQVQQRVLQTQGVALQTEVKIVGERGELNAGAER